MIQTYLTSLSSILYSRRSQPRPRAGTAPGQYRLDCCRHHNERNSRMQMGRVRERVPDWVVRKADQIELVDSSPEQLRRRMLHGNIYPKEKVPQALTHFFRTDNLIALRELALRFVADESDETLLEHLRQHHSQVPWETTERIMVAVTAEPGTDVLLRRAARIASRVKAELDVVHVIVGDTSPSRDGLSIDGLQALAADLGARWHEIDDDDPARALVSFAREHQITQIVIGSIQSSWRPRLSRCHAGALPSATTSSGL